MATTEGSTRQQHPEGEHSLLSSARGAAPVAVVAVSSRGDGDADDLGERFGLVLKDLAGRNAGTDALFEVLVLEVLDWGLDRHVEVNLFDSGDRHA